MNPEHHSMTTGGGQPPGSSEVRMICKFFAFSVKWDTNFT